MTTTVAIVEERIEQTQQTVGLVRDLLDALEDAHISYCHWKSNTAIDDILSGDTDMDLLVAHGDEDRFRQLIRSLGFAEAISRTTPWYCRIEHHYGCDPDTGKMIHIHLHLELIAGHDLLKDYHFPIEEAYLQSTYRSRGLRLPRTEFEFVIFVVRMSLKRHLMPALVASPVATMGALLRGRLPQLSPTDAVDLSRLECESDRREVARLLEHYFPGVTLADFYWVVAALKGDIPRSRWRRAWKRLRRTVQAYRARGPVRTAAVVTYRKIVLTTFMVITRLGLGHPLQRRLKRGCIFAVVGGDGAGKTTNIAALRAWLGRTISVASLHVGRPRKGALWYLLMLPLQALGMLRVVPERFGLAMSYLLVARYRYIACKRAQRLRRRGMVVLLDRIPLPEIRTMDCPRIRSLTDAKGIYAPLARLEERYYGRTKCADRVAVLRLDPEIARQRRPEDDNQMLSARSGEIWNASWSSGRILVVDASDSPARVQQILRGELWKCVTTSPTIAELIGVAGSGKSTIASMLATRTVDTAGSLTWQQSIPTCLRVLIRRLPQVLHHSVRRTKIRYLAIMLNIEITIDMLERHRRSHVLNCTHAILDLGPFLQLATLEHAYLPNAPSLAASAWLKELTVRSRHVVDKVFWLDADDQVLMERVSERRQVHAMKGQSAGSFQTFCAEYREGFARLLSGYPPRQVKRIDTGSISAEHAFELIEAYLP